MRIEQLEDTADKSDLNPFYVSFGDLMVLLCVFFVMMLAMSKIDIGSFEKVKSGITGSTKGTLVELSNKLKKL